uniref:Uncharacterized protein n=1 Tax=Anguilla anguilla TaxID=7936 RepID=A0A0E9UGW7_ANGAN
MKPHVCKQMPLNTLIPVSGMSSQLLLCIMKQVRLDVVVQVNGENKDTVKMGSFR